VFQLLSAEGGFTLKRRRHLSHHLVLMQQEWKMSIVRREMKTKQQKKSNASVCSSFQRRKEEVFYCDFESLDGLRICVNTNVIISESGPHLLDQCTVFTRRVSTPIL